MGKIQELPKERASLAEQIRTLRTAAGLTQAQIAAVLGVTKNAVTNWESGSSRPDLALIVPLCRALGVSADVLFGIARPRQISCEEKMHIALLRRLSENDRANVSVLMRSMIRGYEQDWLREHKDAFMRLPELPLAFAAGAGHPLDEPSQHQTAFVRRNAENASADFIVHVSGQSMEPTFMDGDRVLVERRNVLRPGEIGLFRLPDGDGLIKEYQPDGLHSHNPAYPIRGAKELAGVQCLGHVLARIDESLVPNTWQEALLQDAVRARRP